MLVQHLLQWFYYSNSLLLPTSLLEFFSILPELSCFGQQECSNKILILIHWPVGWRTKNISPFWPRVSPWEIKSFKHTTSPYLDTSEVLLSVSKNKSNILNDKTKYEQKIYHEIPHHPGADFLHNDLEHHWYLKIFAD